MECDLDQVDEITFALLWPTSFKMLTVYEPGRARVGNDGSTLLKRPHSPIRRAKSVVSTEEGRNAQGSCSRSTSR
jgi:hypothetical protein